MLNDCKSNFFLSKQNLGLVLKFIKAIIFHIWYAYLYSIVYTVKILRKQLFCYYYNYHEPISVKTIYSVHHEYSLPL